jgi:signal transduction histidine kinase
MSSLPEEEVQKAWKLAFNDVSFPAFLVDRDGNIQLSNPEGVKWSTSHELIAELKAMKSPTLPVGEGELIQLRGAVLLGLGDGRTLISFGAPECGMIDEYVRLFRHLLRMEETLKSRNDRLEVYHELLTHDAPNFITAVYGYLQMIQSSDLPREKLVKYINTSIKQTEALNHLIDTARTLHQLETTPLGIVESIDLRASVEEATKTVLDSMAGKQPKVIDSIPPGRYVVKGEPDLEMVFKIIIDNAVRYSDSPQVSIDLKDEGSSWHLKFKDNGRGIPDDKKDFLFLRFDRLDKQRKIRGSGLSLALARALVERHGGKIWVDNAVPGDFTKGSVFHVLLPKA